MPTFSYQVAPFLPFTKIVSADVNQDFSDIKTFLNTTKLDSANIQQFGVSLDRLASGTANYAIYRNGVGTVIDGPQLPTTSGGLGFSPTLVGNGGQAVVVNIPETGFTLGSPLQSTLTQSFTADISSLTAGETITANDGVCLDLSLDASSNPVYRVFKADSSLANRKYNFLGFAIASAAVTAGSYTWVASANFVASNSIAFSINGRSYVVPFSTSNTVTLQSVATAMATDPDVNGAVSDGVHTVTVTGKGGLFVNIAGSVVTGGASQPTITVTTVAAPTGANVKIRNFGDLGGFTLTTGYNYYLSTVGTITASPSDSAAVFVGQALSSSVLFVNRNVGQFQFTTPTIFVRTHGTTNAAIGGGVQDAEHFNFISWSAGTSSAAGVRSSGNWLGDQAYAGTLLQLDGDSASTVAAALFQSYNKSTWSTLTNRSLSRSRTGGCLYGSYYSNPGGFTNVGATSTAYDKWNGSAWSSATAIGTGTFDSGAFVQGGFLRIVSGTSGLHQKVNTSDVWATDTVPPTINDATSSSATSGGGYYTAVTTANTYLWNGSWGSAVTLTYTPSDVSNYGAASGYNSGNGLAIVNGGTAGGTPKTTSATYNSTSWSASVSSANARSGADGAVF